MDSQARGRSCEILRMEPFCSVRLGTRWTSIIQSRAASVNSASTLAPLWKRQIAGSVANGAAQVRSFGRGAKARAVTTSTRKGDSVSIRDALITVFGAMARATSIRKATLRWSDSTRVTVISGRSAAMTRPGKPAPEPRSIRSLASGGRRGSSWRESSIWRCSSSSRVERPIRLIDRYHLPSRSA